MSDLIAHVRDPARFTGDVGHPISVWYEVRRETVDRLRGGKRVAWTCTCKRADTVRRCEHLHALWEGRIWEGRIPADIGVLTKPHFLADLTPLGDELLRHRWAAITLMRTT